MSDPRRIEDNYSSREFNATDWSSPTRKNTTRDHGGIQISHNYENGDHGEIVVVVSNPHLNSVTHVAMEKDEAMKMLEHLNTLLGKPMSYAGS